jgi:hypothetical protein
MMPLIAHAQTSTPTPSPTQTPLPSYTPFSTYGWPTLTAIPGLSLTPRPWYTPTPPVPGAAFDPGEMPTIPVSTPIPDQPLPQFTALGDVEVLAWFAAIVYYTVTFWIYLYINFPMLILAGRVIALLLFLWRIAMRLTRRFKELREE